MNQRLSGYVLTHNSEKYLDRILTQMIRVCDELIILDSGSKDKTKEIVDKYNIPFFFKPFKNYTEQRNFAHSLCQHDFVFWMDSDEIPSDDLIAYIDNEKILGFTQSIYSFRRLNHVLDKKVSVFYPVYDPEYRERLCKKEILYESQLAVHETLDRKYTRFDVDKQFYHFTFETLSEIKKKLFNYARLYAQQNNAKSKRWKIFFSPWAAWFKWYIIKGGYKDGSVGFLLGLYTFAFTFLKYYYAKSAVTLQKS